MVTVSTPLSGLSAASSIPHFGELILPAQTGPDLSPMQSGQMSPLGTQFSGLDSSPVQQYGSFMRNFGIASRRQSFASTHISNLSMRAVVNRNIPRATIIRLKDIKEKMGDERELFTDESMLGFNKKQWETALYKKYPIDSTIGFKKNVGQFIKTNFNKKTKQHDFIIRKLATNFQINSLIGYIEGACPSFHYLEISIKNKRGYEQIFNLSSFDDLKRYIKNHLQTQVKIHLRVTFK
jgi:hypothetical protein